MKLKRRGIADLFIGKHRMKGSPALIGIGLFLAGMASAFLLVSFAPDFRFRLSEEDNGKGIQRAISLAPNITETIFALNADSKLRAVSDFCNYPPSVNKKPSVGSIANPSMEEILALHPDAVLVQQPHPEIRSFCENHGIPYYCLRMNSLSSIRQGILKLGKLFGCRERAVELQEDIWQKLDEIRSDVDRQGKPQVLVSTGRTPGSLKRIYAAGSESFLSELVKVAGGENILDDVSRVFSPVSLETIIKRNPDVIIETYMGNDLGADKRRQLEKDWQRLPAVTAVKQGRVHIVTKDYVQIPGPRIIQTARLFQEFCHPDNEG